MTAASRQTGLIEQYGEIAGAADVILPDLARCLHVEALWDQYQPWASIKLVPSNGCTFCADGSEVVAETLALAIKTHLGAIRETFRGLLLAAVGDARQKAEAQAFELLAPVQAEVPPAESAE